MRVGGVRISGVGIPRKLVLVHLLLVARVTVAARGLLLGALPLVNVAWGRRRVPCVVAAQRRLDGLGQRRAGGYSRRVTDDITLVWNPDVPGSSRRILEGNQRCATAEPALFHEEPLRRAGAGIDPHVLESAHACPINVVDARSDPPQGVVETRLISPAEFCGDHSKTGPPAAGDTRPGRTKIAGLGGILHL
jgi:hypothetical protein